MKISAHRDALIFIFMGEWTDMSQVKDAEALLQEQIQPHATRNMVISVTDPALVETTGGIVQGMSGSPILQDGKLVGAVTHVLLNDPTKGYGISIENMLKAA